MLEIQSWGDCLFCTFSVSWLGLPNTLRNLNFEPDEELQQTFCSTPGKFCVLLNYCQTGINGECLKRHKGNCIRYKCKFSKFRQCSLLYDTPSHNKETRIVFYMHLRKRICISFLEEASYETRWFWLGLEFCNE